MPDCVQRDNTTATTGEPRRARKESIDNEQIKDLEKGSTDTEDSEGTRQGGEDVRSKVLRDVEWRDGVGNRYSARLQAMAVGPPSYCLEVFPNGQLWLEDEGIAKLARFFAWLKKHAASEKMMLGEEYAKTMVRVGEASFKSG